MSILASAGFVDIPEQRHLVAQGAWQLGLLHTRVIDSRAPRVFLLRWPLARWGVVDAVQQHYAANLHTEFSFVIPKSGDTVTVMYLGPPRWKGVSQTNFSLTAELEEQVATDT